VPVAYDSGRRIKNKRFELQIQFVDMYNINTISYTIDEFLARKISGKHALLKFPGMISGANTRQKEEKCKHTLSHNTPTSS